MAIAALWSGIDAGPVFASAVSDSAIMLAPEVNKEENSLIFKVAY